jgi:hypothetical protein
MLSTAQLAAESISIPVTKDNSIVLVDGEWTENGGQKGADSDQGESAHRRDGL